MARPVSLARFLSIMGAHDRLLSDKKRNLAFTEALRRSVVSGSHVLDIGAGSGVWAVTAARLGAARVVAIEKEPLLAPVIARLARENGVEDRVQIVTAHSRQAKLPREFDVVVSETIGVLAFDEDIVPLMADARRRFLKEGGAVVPQTIALMAAPVRAAIPRPIGLRISTRYWEALAANVPMNGSGKIRRLAKAACLVAADLRSATRLGRDELTATWTLDDARAVNAIALWAETQLAPGLRLSTFVGTSWPPILLPAGPWKGSRGVLTVALGRTGRVRTWRTVFRGRSGKETQDASPLLAYGALRSKLG